MTIEPVAFFKSAFSSKFGIPRQSSIVDSLRGEIHFVPEYCNPDAVRGLEGFDRVWLIWEFSANRSDRATFRPTVRPPRLGGNTAMGVFATRSPFRPNPLGLSAVRIERIDTGAADAPVIHVLGADLMDGTPIYDIKPYIPYADAFPDAKSGFVGVNDWHKLDVVIPDFLSDAFPEQEMDALKKALELDPRPHYHNDPARVYGFPYDGKDVRFTVDGDVLSVVAIETLP